MACINSDLTSGDATLDLTLAKPLAENHRASFLGIQKTGPFDISGATARAWLLSGGNPNERPNSDVIQPWFNGIDITRRPQDNWIVDFGLDMNEEQAAQYEKPFEHVKTNVLPKRKDVRREYHKKYWWRFGDPRPGMRDAIAGLSRFIVTPEVSKHRLFAWVKPPIVADKNLIVIAREDDTTFGILHSRFHELWSLRMGSSLEDRPRYTSSTTFATFPFPSGLTPNVSLDVGSNPGENAIASAAKNLTALREAWLNPPQWVDVTPEIVPGYPNRIIPKPEYAKAIKERTLTNLYNQSPAWLAHAHEALDAAVASAYGWDDYTSAMSDDEILARLLKLNLARAAAQSD